MHFTDGVLRQKSHFCRNIHHKKIYRKIIKHCTLFDFTLPNSALKLLNCSFKDYNLFDKITLEQNEHLHQLDNTNLECSACVRMKTSTEIEDSTS